jgi:xanthine/uracil/vitamin C permease (AzgA family)
MKSRSPVMAALPAAIVAVVLYALGQFLVRAVGPGWDDIGTGLAGFAAIAAVLIAVNRIAKQAAEKPR